jgi:hypothetical protein
MNVRFGKRSERAPLARKKNDPSRDESVMSERQMATHGGGQMIEAPEDQNAASGWPAQADSVDGDLGTTKWSDLS